MRFLLLILIFISLSLHAQVVDDFSDSDFSASPTWIGDIDSFNALGQRLNSNGPSASSVIHLATANASIDNTEWRFIVNLDFNPSTTNFVKIYLVSNSSNLESSLNGYYVYFGETGNDSIMIYKQSGLSSIRVFKGVRTSFLSTSAGGTIHVKVVRDAFGNWNVYTDNTGASVFVSEGVFFDNTYTATSFMGVLCDYGTASRSNMYHFDNFYIGPIVVDVDPPLIQDFYISNPTTVSILFNEFIDTSTAILSSNFSITPSLLSPAFVRVDSINKRLLHLQYTSPFLNGVSYTCTINSIRDLSGNVMLPANRTFYLANTNDIVINEILADPDSTISLLPNYEFLELFNTSTQAINVMNWQLYDASTIGDVGAVFPSYVIAPGQYVIVCDIDDTLLFQSYGTTLGIDRFPSLNNTDDELLLTNAFGKRINYVHYKDSWYKDAAKKDGGYTLERIDATKACIGEENWSASIDSIGGTPGRANSVIGVVIDTNLPQLLRASFVDSKNIVLWFSESMNELDALNVLNYTVNNGLLISSVQMVDNTGQQVAISFTADMLIGTIYTVTVQNCKDCSGNSIGVFNQATFGIPQVIEAGDIVINEILFNPVSNGYDFVELYNRSTKILDLANVKILEQDPNDTSTYSDNAIITTSSFLVMPGSYVVLTENVEQIKQQYITENPGALIHVSGMPNYPDDEGIVELQLTLTRIDKLYYDNAWHFPLLDNEDGVSLERIDYNNTTQLQSNWHSASANVGFATPTYKNSQFIGNAHGESVVTIQPEIFTPDEDGNNDVTTINYTFDKPGYMLSIKIFDANGRLIRTLLNNEMVSDICTYTWDGITEGKEKARTGIYIIYSEVFDVQGKTKRYKNKVVLGSNYK